jgi:hypothetical protein
MANIFPTLEEIERARLNFRQESEPFIKRFTEIEALKIPKRILNPLTGEVVTLKSEDTIEQIEIKNYLEGLKKKYSFLGFNFSEQIP